MINENSKFSMASMMAYESQRIRYAVSHSRGTGTSHASQSVRAELAAKPLPTWIPKTDKQGQNNTGKIWSF